MRTHNPWAITFRSPLEFKFSFRELQVRSLRNYLNYYTFSFRAPAPDHKISTPSLGYGVRKREDRYVLRIRIPSLQVHEAQWPELLTLGRAHAGLATVPLSLAYSQWNQIVSTKVIDQSKETQHT